MSKLRRHIFGTVIALLCLTPVSVHICNGQNVEEDVGGEQTIVNPSSSALPGGDDHAEPPKPLYDCRVIEQCRHCTVEEMNLLNVCAHKKQQEDEVHPLLRRVRCHDQNGQEGDFYETCFDEVVGLFGEGTSNFLLFEASVGVVFVLSMFFVRYRKESLQKRHEARIKRQASGMQVSISGRELDDIVSSDCSHSSDEEELEVIVEEGG